MRLSIILPSRNEAKPLKLLLPELHRLYPQAELLVVDDGSEDDTEAVCNQPGVRIIKLPESLGNGAAIKAGARAAQGEILIFMDADGQHQPKDVQRLIDGLEGGYDMAVGSRDGRANRSVVRYLGNQFYNLLASWVTGHKVVDLTSGFRAAHAVKFIDFLNILPNGFSAPTTITMAFFRAGYSVKYVPVDVKRDEGRSHINLFRDGIRFLLIIFRIAVLYSPLKIFFPASATIFITGFGYYLYTYLSDGRFTNMGILLFITSIIVFLIGLISEQITFLIYLDKKK
jgi:glycosyltransferase involved in cell wall biosynthesis